MFPQNIKIAVNQFRTQLLLPHKELVETFVKHEKGLFEDGDVSGKWNVSTTQFSFLCRAIDATNSFAEPTNLAVFVRTYLSERYITRSTMVNYLILFEKMVELIRAYKRTAIPAIMENDWQKIIKDVRRKYQKSSLKEKRSKRELFTKVPEMEGVAFVVKRIEELCNQALAKENLSFEELKVFNFITLSSTMNGRVGPLMDLTYDDVKRIKTHGKLTSDNHKTGHYYDQEIKISEEQFPWLQRLRSEFKKKCGFRPKLVFATSKDTKDHSMAATIRKVLSKFFDDDVLEKDYNGTSIRKMWDTYFHYHSDEIPTEARAFHAIQSSHTKETAKETGSDFYRKTLKATASGSPSTVTKFPAATKSSSGTKSPAVTKNKMQRPTSTPIPKKRRRSEESESFLNQVHPMKWKNVVWNHLPKTNRTT